MENPQTLNLQSLFFTIAVPVIVGLILLIIEYRTRWFANHLSTINNKSTTESLLVGRVISLGELENPVGDWIQIAEQVRKLLERDTKPERSGAISLLEIQPDKKKHSAKLTYAFWGNPPNDDPYNVYWKVHVTINEDGRIVDYRREC